MANHTLLIFSFSRIAFIPKQDMTVLLDSELRLQRALEIIANHPEGHMRFRLPIPSQSDFRGEVYIRWTARSRPANTKPILLETDSAINPDTQIRQDSSMRLVDAEPYACDNGTGQSGNDVNGGEDGDDADACAVCLSRAPDCELRPCGHARCCRRCVVATICTWQQEGPPRCALCRAPFHAMVFLG
jgi:hypothetical protein